MKPLPPYLRYPWSAAALRLLLAHPAICYLAGYSRMMRILEVAKAVGGLPSVVADMADHVNINPLDGTARLYGKQPEDPKQPGHDATPSPAHQSTPTEKAGRRLSSSEPKRGIAGQRRKGKSCRAPRSQGRKRKP